MAKPELTIKEVPITELKLNEHNPRKWDKETLRQLKESIKRFGTVEPLIANSAPERYMNLIGGHFRVSALKELGYTTAPVVFVHISDEAKEKELALRLNRNVGEFNYDLLAEFDESLLADVGFSSEEMDDIFGIDETPEMFDLDKELGKLDIKNIEVKKGDLYQLGEHVVMCGDSTKESDILRLMGSDKADMCLTDPPYILDYLKGKKKNGKPTEGFGYKRDRKYLETDTLPENFTALWMASITKIQKENFSILCYENWKNLRTIWSEMEKYWKVKNMVVWHLNNRTQGFSAKYKFFSKHDIAMVGTSEPHDGLNLEPEETLLQEEYETALFAISGKPHWESYGKNKKYCPTDFIEYRASDEKSSGQGIIFGTKPLEILIPYLKVLTKRDDIVVEPFGGSGSTLIACEKMKRKCRLMEKSPVYAQVIIRRWEILTGLKGIRISNDPTYGQQEADSNK